MVADESFEKYADLLLALLGFYAALSTVFIPLTFALIAQLKDQYRESLDKRALASKHSLIFRFQQAFFPYNDLFSQVVIYVSISGVVVSGWTYWYHFSEHVGRYWPRPCWLLVLAVLLHILAIPYVRGRSHPVIFRRQPDLLDQLRAEWEKSKSKMAEPRWSGKHWKVLVVMTFLCVWIIPTALSFHKTSAPDRDMLKFTSLLLAFNAAVLIGIWWDFYVAWQPFSFLKEVEGLPDDPRYAEQFLRVAQLEESDGSSPRATLPPSWEALLTRWRASLATPKDFDASVGGHLQQRTYNEFMPQYEDDDRFRVAAEEGWDHLCDTVKLKLDKPSADGAKLISEWASEVGKRLELASAGSSKPTVPIVYIGSGYCSLALSVTNFVRGVLDEQKVADAVPLKLYLIDSVTVKRTETEMHNEKVRRLAEVVTKAEAQEFNCDAHTFFRVLLGEVKETPHSEEGDSESHLNKLYGCYAKASQIRQAFGEVMENFVPPLVILLNNTFGDLVDPTPPHVVTSGNTQHATSEDLTSGLLDLSRRSGRELLALIARAFAPTGWWCILHVKEAGRLPPGGTFPYNEDRWIRLAGTDPFSGVFLLGRWQQENEPFTMLARWPSRKQLRDDFNSALNTVEETKKGHWKFDRGQAADEFSPFEGSLQEWKNIVWVGKVLPNASSGPWSRVTMAAVKDYDIEAEVRIASQVFGPIASSMGVSASTEQAETRLLDVETLIDIGSGAGGFAVELVKDMPVNTARLEYLPIDLNATFENAASDRFRKAIKRPEDKNRTLAESRGSLQERFEEAVSHVSGDKAAGVVVLLWNVLHHMVGEDLDRARELLEKCRDSTKPTWILVSVFSEPSDSWGEDRGEAQKSLVWRMMAGDSPRASSFCAGRKWLVPRDSSGILLLGVEFDGDLVELSREKVAQFYRHETTVDCLVRRVALLRNQSAARFELETKNPKEAELRAGS